MSLCEGNPEFNGYRNTSPGGYIEVSDICFPVLTDDDTFPKDSALQSWATQQLNGSKVIGRPLDAAKNHKAELQRVGYTDITVKQFIWPMNPWPRDPKYKELGMWNCENFSAGVSGFSIALFTRVLGWTPEQLEVFLVDVRKEIKDTRIHAYFPM